MHKALSRTSLKNSRFRRTPLWVSTNFAAGCDYVRAAETMITKDLRVNNEFYVAPVYNELIAEEARIGRR
jgi:hypothetical protein